MSFSAFYEKCFLEWNVMNGGILIFVEQVLQVPFKFLKSAFAKNHFCKMEIAGI